MQANYVQRLRFSFSKIGPTRYIGHLDLARTLERALNRAEIPIAYTQGFNRRPRLSLAGALPLGYTSEAELADIWLAERVEPELVREQMMRTMAPGIVIHHVAEVPLSAPSLQSATVSGTYEVTLLDPVDLAALEKRVADFLDAETLIRERQQGRKGKVKQYDLRPLVYRLSVEHAADGTVKLIMEVSLLPGETGRPDEILMELGLDPLAARIHRTQLVVADEQLS